MQVAVRLGREAGDDLLDLAGSEVRLDDLPDEVAGGWKSGLIHSPILPAADKTL
jgi:hypothetical protein